MRIALVVALLVAVAAPARAQQQPPDPAFLMKVLAALQQQRNSALDVQAEFHAQAATQADEIAKLKARIADLEKAVQPPEPAK